MLWGGVGGGSGGGGGGGVVLGIDGSLRGPDRKASIFQPPGLFLVE